MISFVVIPIDVDRHLFMLFAATGRSVYKIVVNISHTQSHRYFGCGRMWTAWRGILAKFEDDKLEEIVHD